MEQQNQNTINPLFLSFKKEPSEIYQKILNSITDGIFITDKNDKIIFYNSSLGLILGKTDYNLSGVDFLKFFNDIKYKELNDFFLNVKENMIAENKIVELNSNSAASIIINCLFLPLEEKEEIEGMIGIIKNISQKTKEENELIISHTILKDAEKLSNTGSWDWNIDTGIAYWSDNCFKIHGIKKEDGVPDFIEYLKLLLPSDQDSLSNKVSNALKEESIYNAEYRIITRDTHCIKSVHSFGYVLKDEFNSQHLRGITIDITNKKSEEQELDKKKNDLEKFNKYFVGREERMVELKEEINELRAKLNLPKKYFSPDEIED